MKQLEGRSDNPGQHPDVIFATYVQSNEQLLYACFLAESIREFAGRLRTAPIRVYIPMEFDNPDKKLLDRLSDYDVETRQSRIPEYAAWFYYAGKVFAASMAEGDAENAAAVLIWLDDDTIFLREPADLILDDSISFAYRPVMHNRSGSLYDEPPDPFWSRIYRILEVSDNMLFPVVTPADQQKIRAYFNAGLLAVRPAKAILRRWAQAFTDLCRDSVITDMCRQDVTNRIFLHQTALVGAVLKTVARDQTRQLSDAYNYPLFFKRQYGALHEFDDLSEVITLRYDVYFKDPDPGWQHQLKGPPRMIQWLSDRLGSEEQR